MINRSKSLKTEEVENPEKSRHNFLDQTKYRRNPKRLIGSRNHQVFILMTLDTFIKKLSEMRAIYGNVLVETEATVDYDGIPQFWKGTPFKMVMTPDHNILVLSTDYYGEAKLQEYYDCIQGR